MCNDGYALVGALVLNCLPNGKYDNDEPFCVEVLCPSLQGIENAQTSGDGCAGAVPGGTCSVICSNGEACVSDCGDNGLWDPAPEWEPTACPFLLPPEGGSTSGACVPGETGETCRFSCDPPMRVIGKSVVKCGQNGWVSD